MRLPCYGSGMLGTGLLRGHTGDGRSKARDGWIVTETASEVIFKGCGGQAAVRGTYCLAGDTALFSWTRLLTKEPLPVPPPLPQAGAPRRKHQASRKGGGAGKQARHPPHPNVRCTSVLGEVGVTQAGGTREALLCGCCEALGPGVPVQASRQGGGGDASL